MKCVILAAGYATRLYPLTENFPKPLLKVGEKTILDWLIDDIASSGLVDQFIVVSNHKFASIFEQWAKERGEIPSPASRVRNDKKELVRNDKKELVRNDNVSVIPSTPSVIPSTPSVIPSEAKESLTVLDDGTESNETRLGAVRDIQLAIERCALDDDLLVIAGDNLLDFSLVQFIEYSRAKGTSCVMRYWEPSVEKLRKTGVASVDSDGRILSMVEKPADPQSHWCCPPFYFYRHEDLPLVAKGIAEGCGVDAPGSFIAWLSTQVPVHAFEMPGRRYDIGNLASYEEVQRTYRGIVIPNEVKES